MYQCITPLTINGLKLPESIEPEFVPGNVIASSRGCAYYRDILHLSEAGFTTILQGKQILDIGAGTLLFAIEFYCREANLPANQRTKIYSVQPRIKPSRIKSFSNRSAQISRGALADIFGEETLKNAVETVKKRTYPVRWENLRKLTAETSRPPFDVILSSCAFPFWHTSRFHLRGECSAFRGRESFSQICTDICSLLKGSGIVILHVGDQFAEQRQKIANSLKQLTAHQNLTIHILQKPSNTALCFTKGCDVQREWFDSLTRIEALSG